MSILIVIPAFNAAAFLAPTVESVLAQTHPDWRLIIVDDGSTDGTSQIAREYARRDGRVEVISQPNSGLASARNRGLAVGWHAGDWVAFLDADDVWEADALKRLGDKLDASPQAAAACGLSRFIDPEGRLIGPGVLEAWGRHREGVEGRRLVTWAPESPTTLAVLSYRNCIQTPGQVVIRRPALEAAGPFDARAAPCEDWDMWLRLCQAGEMAFLDHVVLNYRRHPHNMSGNLEWVTAGERYLRLKLLRNSALTQQQRALVFTANCLWGVRVCKVRLRLARGHMTRREWGMALAEAVRGVTSYGRCCRGLPPQ